jgi:hypothetical protein
MDRKLIVFALSAALGFLPVLAGAQTCPPEVDEAKKLLTSLAAKQPPRQLAGARGQDAQAPRGQGAQAPRGQDAQAPRGQDAQAPRGQDAQAPRGQDAQAPRDQQARGTTVTNASRLVKEAEGACKQGDNSRALANARAALELLKYLQ